MAIRQYRNKEEFTTYAMEHITMRNMLTDFVDKVFFPLIAKFNGKVLVSRLIKALNEEAQKITPLMSVHKWSGDDEIEIQIRTNNRDYESILVSVTINTENKIDYEETLKDTYLQKWIDDFRSDTELYQKAIDNYDSYMAIADKLDKILNEYNKLPYMFRNNIDSTILRIY